MAERRDDWEEHRREQLRAWMRATPAERLAAVEELIDFVLKAGVRPRDEKARTGPRKHTRPSP